MLQWINLNESFRQIILYIMKIDVTRFEKKCVPVVSDIFQKALKVQILNEVALKDCAIIIRRGALKPEGGGP